VSASGTTLHSLGEMHRRQRMAARRSQSALMYALRGAVSITSKHTNTCLACIWQDLHWLHGYILYSYPVCNLN